MELYIDTGLCVGCGLCEEMAPAIFSIGDYHARIVRQPITADEKELMQVILRDCPAGAIKARKEG